MADNAELFVSLRRVHPFVFFHEGSEDVGSSQLAFTVFESWRMFRKLLDENFVNIRLLGCFMRCLGPCLSELLDDELLLLDI